jgi:acyl-CoA thioester hydrolase
MSDDRGAPLAVGLPSGTILPLGQGDTFRFTHRRLVSLRDLDGFRHVNNSVYLTYCEDIRVAYLDYLFHFSAMEQIANVMVRATLDFRRPLSYGDTVTVGVRTARLGGKSFTLEYQIAKQDGETAVTANTVHVAYDFAKDRSVLLPEHWRLTIADYEAGGAS